MDQISRNRIKFRNNNNNKIEIIDNLIINQQNIIIGKMEERRIQENIKKEQEIEFDKLFLNKRKKKQFFY